MVFKYVLFYNLYKVIIYIGIWLGNKLFLNLKNIMRNYLFVMYVGYYLMFVEWF